MKKPKKIDPVGLIISVALVPIIHFLGWGIALACMISWLAGLTYGVCSTEWAHDKKKREQNK